MYLKSLSTLQNFILFFIGTFTLFCQVQNWRKGKNMDTFSKIAIKATPKPPNETTSLRDFL